MESLIKKILEIATGKKAKIFWAVILAIIVLLLLLYPLVGRSIPTIINVWINAIVFPCIQLAIIGLIIYGNPNSNKKE